MEEVVQDARGRQREQHGAGGSLEVSQEGISGVFNFAAQVYVRQTTFKNLSH